MYIGGILLLSLLYMWLALFVIIGARDAVAFRDAAVVAHDDKHWCIVFAFPLLIFPLSAIIFLAGSYHEKKPLFGKRGIRYGEEPWEKDLYPLFSRERKSASSPTASSRRRRKVSLWCAGLVLAVCLSPLSFFGRTCLRQDLRIVTYSVFNRPVEKSYSPADYSELAIRARYVPGRAYIGGGHWRYEIVLTKTDRTWICFSNHEFRGAKLWGDQSECIDLSLKTMTAIKARFPADRITIIGADLLGGVSAHFRMNRAQTEALYRLFDKEAQSEQEVQVHASTLRSFADQNELPLLSPVCDHFDFLPSAPIRRMKNYRFLSL